MTERQLGSRRPYLLRAMYEWMSDNAQTPQLVVDATVPGVDVPDACAGERRLTLNISSSATRELDLGQESIEFWARFSGIEHFVRIPLAAVQGIYARECGHGMLFAVTEVEPDTGSATEGQASTDEKEQAEGTDSAVRGRHLKLVE